MLYEVITCLVVGFVGVGLVLQPSAELLRNPQSLLATAAALFSAIALVAVNRLSSTEKPDTTLFYYFLIATIVITSYSIHYTKLYEAGVPRSP